MHCLFVVLMLLASTAAQLNPVDEPECRYQNELNYDPYVVSGDIKSPNYAENGQGKYCHNMRMVRTIDPGLLLSS